LPEETILTDDFLRELINVGEVVQAIRAGLLKYFPRQRAVIINADGGSRDGSQELVRAASISDLQHASNVYALRTLHCVSTEYSGGPSSSVALHTILAAAELLQASSCAVIAPDSTNIEPGWIESLLRPVTRDGFDLVTPIYRRHKFDGLLIRNLLYPMNRALYLRRVREPFPLDFAFSGRLGTHFLGQDFWSQEPGRIGAEIYLTISAIAGEWGRDRMWNMLLPIWFRPCGEAWVYCSGRWIRMARCGRSKRSRSRFRPSVPITN